MTTDRLGAPLLLVTGYDPEIVPKRFLDTPRIEPIADQEVTGPSYLLRTTLCGIRGRH